jgi:hypothetical protein
MLYDYYVSRNTGILGLIFGSVITVVEPQVFRSSPAPVFIKFRLRSRILARSIIIEHNFKTDIY